MFDHRINYESVGPARIWPSQNMLKYSGEDNLVGNQKVFGPTSALAGPRTVVCVHGRARAREPETCARYIRYCSTLEREILRLTCIRKQVSSRCRCCVLSWFYKLASLRRRNAQASVRLGQNSQEGET